MKIVTAIIVALSLVATLSQAEAAQRKHHKHYNHYARVSPQVRGFLFHPGGHQMGYEADPLLYKNGGYGNYPFNDPRNFWERVQSGPFDESTSPSAF